MAQVKLQEKFNRLYKGFLKIDKTKYKFYFGSYLENIEKIISKIAPYSTVCIVSSNRSFMRYGKNLYDFLLSIGNKPVNVVLDSISDSIDDACGLFNLPEDTRCIICLEDKYFNVLAYFANIKKIPMIIMPTSFGINNMVKSRVEIKSNNQTDLIKINIVRHIVVDKLVLMNTGDFYLAYSIIMSKLPAFIDYRFYSAITKKSPAVFAYNTAKTAVSDTFDCFEEKTDLTEKMICNLFAVLLADEESGGKLFGTSAINVASKLYNNLTDEDKLLLSMHLMYIYSVASKKGYNLVEIADYIERVQFLQDKTSEDLSELTNSYVEQNKLIGSRLDGIGALLSKLDEEIQSLYALYDSIKKRYLVLSGKKELETKEDLFEVLKYCGDYKDNINLLSYLRETGFLECVWKTK